MDDWTARRGDHPFERVPFGFFLTLPDRKIIHSNAMIREWLEFSEEELYGKRKLTDLLTMGGKIYYETHHNVLENLQGFVRELNYTLRARDRSEVDVLMNTQRITNDAGEHQYTEVYLFRFSERQKYEKELLRAKKLAEETMRTKSQFLSKVSHDVRTPVHVVLALAKLLRDTALSPVQDEMLEALDFNAEQLLGLVDDLLDFNKLERRAHRLHPTEWELRPALRTFARGMSSRVDDERVYFEFDLDETLPEYVRADRKKLFQILGNLLGNAVKFTRDGFVRFAVRRGAEVDLDGAKLMVQFEIADSGIGISEEKQETIFEAFQQADASISTTFGGTGLGLSIVKELVELHTGYLELSSQPGAGTTFTIGLPLEVGTPPELELEMPADPLIDLSGYRILVAEDNETNVFILQRVFAAWQLPFDRARTGREAVRLAESNAYDLVLMDLQMPEMNGTEATRAIRRLPGKRFRDLPILILTAGTEADVQRAIDEAGATDWVDKSFERTGFLKQLRQWLPAKAAPAAEPSAAVTYAELFGFFDHDTEDIRGYLGVVLNDWTDLRQKMQIALEQRDEEAYRQIVHQMHTGLRLLQFETFAQLLAEGIATHELAHLLTAFDAALTTLQELRQRI